MDEPMGVWVEVWPVAADARPWLVRDPWKDHDGAREAGVVRVAADDSVHAMAEYALHRLALPKPVVLHSMSWRQDGPRLLVTYVAVIEVGDYVRAIYPTAMPVNSELIGVVGRPAPHGAAEPPSPRDVDVLFHSLRHLAFLASSPDDPPAPDEDALPVPPPPGDAEVRRALEGTMWPGHLRSMKKELAWMYWDRLPA